MAVSANRLELLQIADAVAREKSIDRPSMRGGVPVFRRPCGSFSSFRRADRLTAGGSPARPAA